MQMNSYEAANHRPNIPRNNHKRYIKFMCDTLDWRYNRWIIFVAHGHMITWTKYFVLLSICLCLCYSFRFIVSPQFHAMSICVMFIQLKFIGSISIRIQQSKSQAHSFFPITLSNHVFAHANFVHIIRHFLKV